MRSFARSMLKLMLWPSSFLLLAVACKDASISQSKIINGEVISENSWQEVEQISWTIGGGASGSCTGTFISDSTFITAAHCVTDDSGRMHGVYLSRNKVQSTKVIWHPKWQGRSDNHTHDLALVIFPSGTARKFAKIYPHVARKGDKITIVGYGGSRVQPGLSEAILKRVGTNTLLGLASDGSLLFKGPPFPDGKPNNAGIAPGDSGGPLFINGQIVGTTRGGLQDGTAYYVNLQQRDNHQFLKDAPSQGAVIKDLPQSFVEKGEAVKTESSKPEADSTEEVIMFAINKNVLSDGSRHILISASFEANVANYCLGTEIACMKDDATWFVADRVNKSKRPAIFQSSGSIKFKNDMAITFAAQNQKTDEWTMRTIKLQQKSK